uniref:family 78 glycoside hydrolase catalytic domain n=1 Tax=Candidatus Fimenecus sp. TaxID=3022888 RepID=UPI00402583DA
MKAINLKCEYLINPIGIDIQNPRLMWNCDGGIKQTAYRIVAKSDEKTVWDSGKVNFSSMYAEYPHKLKSRERVEWAVTLWDEEDKDGEPSETAFFETGLLAASDFTAKWISGNYRVNKKKRYPVDCFKKQFAAQNIAKARLYITACGLYEAKINGQRVGNFVLAPGHTDYTKRIQLQTYDVAKLLRNGENDITVELADGWYRGSCGAWGLKNQYGTQTKLYAQLEITDKTGKVTIVGTDKTWAWSDDGKIRFADNKDGEVVEAWRVPSYSGFAKETKCDVMPVSSNNVPVTEHERFTVKQVVTTPGGAKVLDFGQNIAGYISFAVTAKRGQKIKLRFGEMFDENGEFTQKNFQCANKKRTKVTPLQQIEYFCKDGLNEYKTKFAIFGFQYVLIESDAEWKKEDFTAIAVYSDMEETLSFDSSNELLNKLVEATRWSAKNNHADVPTDCPTRERHGWTGDAQIFCNTASYLFNFAPFARKYVSDMVDGQRKNGKFRQITPKGGVDFYMDFMDGSAGWSDAGVLIPYRIYKRYGDKKILESSYAAMKKYADFKIKTLGKWYPTAIRTGIDRKYKKYISNYGQSYGEWAEPTEVHITGFKDFACPHPEETTAYIVYMLQTMAEIAEVLGKTDDKKRFSEYAEKAKIGYNKLLECPKFSLDTDRQAKLVRPLYMNLLNEEQAKFAENRLVAALDNYDWRLGTGFLSTPFILYVLEKIDVEYAYKLLENEQMPGWLFMPKMHANTIWESWEGTEAQGGIASLDHYSKGAVCEWLFGDMCGIKVSGENEFTIAPKAGGKFTFAECEYQSVYGKVKSGWERQNGKTAYKIVIPANTTAKVILPGGEKTLTAGEYEFAEE